MTELMMNKPKDESASRPDTPTPRDGGPNEVARKDRRDASMKPKAQSPVASSREPEARRWKEGLRGKFQRFMTAAAFAESGETDTALEIAYAPAKAAKVLLVVGAPEESPDAVRYAANLCARMDAGLDVILAARHLPAEAEEAIERFARERAQKIRRLIRQVSDDVIPVRVLAVFGEVHEEVYSYAKTNKDVAVIVFDSGHPREKKPARANWESILQRLSRKLGVPTITAVSKSPVGSG